MTGLVGKAIGTVGWQSVISRLVLYKIFNIFCLVPSIMCWFLIFVVKGNRNVDTVSLRIYITSKKEMRCEFLCFKEWISQHIWKCLTSCLIISYPKLIHYWSYTICLNQPSMVSCQNHLIFVPFLSFFFKEL